MLWVEKRNVYCALILLYPIIMLIKLIWMWLLEKKIDLKKRESFFAGQYVKAPSFSLDLFRSHVLFYKSEILWAMRNLSDWKETLILRLFIVQFPSKIVILFRFVSMKLISFSLRLLLPKWKANLYYSLFYQKILENEKKKKKRRIKRILQKTKNQRDSLLPPLFFFSSSRRKMRTSSLLEKTFLE